MRTVRDERGSVSLFSVGIVLAAVLLTALIVDGGQIRLQRRRAGDIAQQAARAGAQQVDEGSRLSGQLLIDPGRAGRAAQAVLSAHGADGVADVSDHSVTVDVTIAVDLVFLDAVGDRTVSASRTVDAVEGV